MKGFSKNTLLLKIMFIEIGLLCSLEQIIIYNFNIVNHRALIFYFYFRK